METTVIILLVILIVILTAALLYMQRQFGSLRSDYETQLRRLGDESLQRNMQYMKAANEESLSALLTPLKIRIEDFNRSIQRSHEDAQAGRHTISTQLENLRRMNETINAETRNLANALRGNNGALGKWGEAVLESLLSAGGLVKGETFITQYSKDDHGRALISESGSMLRPDVVIRLPDNRNIIIDAKATLAAYLEYCNAPDKSAADNAARRHVESVKRNIDILASKQYQKSVGNAMKQVLMFIPNDAALIVAINTDPALTEYATRHNVTLVGPIHLISIVQLVTEIWRNDRKDRNAEEIAELGGRLYDAVAGFMDSMAKINSALGSAQKAYEAAYSRLTSAQGVVNRAERLRKMGAKTTRKINATVSEPGTEARD